MDPNQIDEEIVLLKNEIKRLKNLKAKMTRAKPGEPEWITLGNPYLDRIVRAVYENPGIDREGLRDRLPKHISERELTNFLVKIRRNRSLIKNRGSRRNPRWYYVG